jgi:Ca-activated chloride channel family protein
MLHLKYWISELADLTGVSTRTIRYYIEEGLLPAPEIEGRYAVFNEGYVYRLKLIKYLKDAFLPLREIRTLLDRWDDDQIRRKVAEFERDPLQAARTLGVIATTPPSAVGASLKESAADYLSQVMSAPQQERGHVSPGQRQHNLNHANQVSAAPGDEMRLEMPSEPESWQRFSLGEGIELWVRHPISRETKYRLDLLMEQARSLFTKREEIENGTHQDTDQE